MSFGPCCIVSTRNEKAKMFCKYRATLPDGQKKVSRDTTCFPVFNHRDANVHRCFRNVRTKLTDFHCSRELRDSSAMADQPIMTRLYITAYLPYSCRLLSDASSAIWRNVSINSELPLELPLAHTPRSLTYHRTLVRRCQRSVLRYPKSICGKTTRIITRMGHTATRTLRASLQTHLWTRLVCASP